MVPSFESVITAEWLAAALDRGTWDPDHGSEISRWLEDLASGEFEPDYSLPNRLVDADSQEVFRDIEFQSILKNWLASRYVFIVEGLREVDARRLGRRLRVDSDWLEGFTDGSSTLGLFYGSLPLDDGDFWIDQEKPLDIYVEVEATEDDIDWAATLLARMDYLWGDEEQEVRLKPNRKVEIDLLCVNGHPMPEFEGIIASTGASWPRLIPNLSVHDGQSQPEEDEISFGPDHSGISLVV